MHLSSRPARAIVRAISDAAARWSDGDFPPRIRALDGIAGRTGYCLPVVEYALDRLFGSLTADGIEAVITAELGSIDALDGFVERHARPRARAMPLGRVCVVSSRSTIGVAIVPAIFALCAKCDVLVKDREDSLVGAFFATLAEELDEFAGAAIAQTWDGAAGSKELEGFACVAAFGRDTTLSRIASSLSLHTRMIPFGSKASFGYVGRDALENVESARDVARGAARDLVLYDTEGCLSLHVLFVEREGRLDGRAFAALLAREVERAAIEFPFGTRTAESALKTAAARDLAAFRAATGSGAVYSDSVASYLAVLDPPATDPPAFLPRALGIHSVDSPQEAQRYLQCHAIPVEAVAIAGRRDDIVAMAVASGVSRIAAFGDLQSPPIGHNHGGRPRIADFVRWVSDET